MLGSLIAGHIGHLQLLDYSAVYVCCAFLVALTIPHILANVPESIHSQSAISDNAESTSSATVPGIAAGPYSAAQASGKLEKPFLRSLLNDISALLSNRTIVPLFVGEFFYGISGGVDTLVAAMTIASFHWRQGDLELYQSPTPMIVLMSTLVGAPMLTSYFGGRPLPEWFICVLTAFNAIILVMSGFAALHPAFLLAPRYVWSIFAFQTPLMSARIASLVGGDGQAKLFALRTASSSIAYAVALQLFSSGIFFDPAATGVSATMPFVVSGVIGCAGCLIMLRSLAPKTCSRLWPVTNEEERESLSCKSQMATTYAASYGSDA